MDVSSNAPGPTAVKIVPKTRLLVVSAIFTASWFSLLAYRPLFEPDEGRYAEIPREMAAGGDWIVPHLNGLAYIEKPPLQYWLTAIAFKILGENEFAARFCTGLAGYLCVVLVYFVASRLWGSRVAIRAFLLISGSSLFVLLGHQLTLDMTLTFWLTLCLGCFLVAQTSQCASRGARAWMLGCWAAMAMATLTKGLIGVIIPGSTLVVYALWQRDYRVFRRLCFGWGLLLFTILAVPWFVAAALANRDFARFFFIREHFQRFLTPIEHRSEPWWYFAPVMLVGVLPWLPQAARALLCPGSLITRGHYDARRVLWVWSVFVLLFFSVSNAKLIPYILPVVPALALLCAVHETPMRKRVDLIAGAVLSLAAGIGILLYVSGIWSTAGPLAAALRPVLIPTGLLLAGIGLMSLSLAVQNHVTSALGVLCTGWYVACAGFLVAANAAQPFFSAKEVATSLQYAAPSSPIFCVRTYDQSLPFYLRRTVTLVDYRDEFDFGLRLNPELGVATLDEFSHRWLALEQAYAVMPRRVRNTLALQGLPMRQIATYQHDVVVARR